MNRTTRKLWRVLPVGFALLPALSLPAQDDPDDEDIIELTPFEVSASDMEGYSATATLAGTRVKTDLRDVASSISVVTEQFLRDTGANDQESLLVYTPSTEVSGMRGNAALLGNSSGISDTAALVTPSQNTRVRGLATADNTRDFFRTDIPWDSFNVERVDLQRGPNSILFGVGSPAGIINTTTSSAVFQNEGEIELRFDEENSLRFSVDFNREIIEDLLAVRVAGLIDHQQYQQEPAFENDERIYGALRFEPKLLGADAGPLSLRVNFESGDIEANRPRFLPPYDHITPWFDRLDQRVFDPRYSWAFGQQLDRGGRPYDWDNMDPQPALGQDQPGWLRAVPAFIFGNNLAASPDYFRQTQLAADTGGIGDDGTIDGNISGLPIARPQWPAGYNEYSKNVNLGVDSSLFPAASKEFYKDKVLTDPSIFNFYKKLIDGDTKREWNEWTAYNVALSQSFFDGRLAVELVYDYQDVTRGQEGLITSFNPFIAVDVNSHWSLGEDPLTKYPAPVDNTPPPEDAVTGGTRNPFVARAFTSGSSFSGNHETSIERENLRLTVFGELRADDFLDPDSLLASILGRHRFTGLAQSDEADRSSYDYQQYASTGIGDLSGLGAFDPTEENFAISTQIYLSDRDLRNVSSASGLNLDRIHGDFQPHGSYEVSFFDPTWAPPAGVNPGDIWVSPFNNAELTQAENPYNYVGWSTRTVDVLNARHGDLDSLVRNGSRTVSTIDSVGLTWQGFFFDGVVVPTVGWREDTIETTGRSLERSRHVDLSGVTPVENEAELLSWGVVVRTPTFLRRHLPAGMDVSVFYNEGENVDPSVRYGYDTKPLPFSAGDTEEYGFVLSVLDERLTFKMTWYETVQQNVSLTGGPLGSNGWWLRDVEAWVIGKAIMHERWRRNEPPFNAGFSNWYSAAVTGTFDPNEMPEEGLDHPVFQTQLAAIEDVYKNLPDQEWFDAFGYPVDVSAARSDDWATRRDGAITDPNWFPGGYFDIQSATGGTINGQGPSMTIEQVSKGVEFEVIAQPIPHWNITLNVANQDAYRGEIGASTVEWIESRYEVWQGPAGDLKRWWSNDQTIRQTFEDWVWAPYQFQKSAAGQAAPEVREWRANLVTTYNFTEGRLKGAYVGGAYRWQDEIILGYELNDALDNLDVNRPIKGAAEDSLDLWIGYSRALSDEVDWRIQFNVRNAFEDDSLIPVSVNPNGEVAAYRISEGMSWFVTNTFSF